MKKPQKPRNGLAIANFLQNIRAAISGKEQDYTKITLKKGILLLSVPMILEMAMESLFAVVDIFFVGRLGSHAVATVGLTESIVTIVYSIGIGISMAATAMVARRVGEKNLKEAGTTAYQLIVFGGIISLFISFLGWNFAEYILRYMGGSPEVIEQGTAYTRIIFAGNTAIMLLYLINGAFRGAGLPHLAMRSLWISNGINIVLDPILIFGIGNFSGYGLEGAAMATTTGRGIGVLYQLFHLFNGKHLLKITRENLHIKFSDIRNIVKISVGGMGQFLVESASWIVLTRIIAEFGSTAVAGFTISLRVIIFTLMPAWGLSSAAATLVGQNLGALKVRRAELSVWLTARYNFIFMGVVMVVYLVFGDFIAGIFSNEPAVIHTAATSIRIIVLGYIFFAIGMVMIQAFNGAGDTKTPAFINIMLLWMIQIPLAYGLSFHTGFQATGVFITIAFCHSIHAFVSLWFFNKGKWKTVKV